MSDLYEVTQADREFSARYLRAKRITKGQESDILDGIWDESEYVLQAARHRLSTPSPDLKADNAALVEALRSLLAYAEASAVQIEGEWGCCRNLAELEADGDLEPEILAARAALQATEPRP